MLDIDFQFKWIEPTFSNNPTIKLCQKHQSNFREDYKYHSEINRDTMQVDLLDSGSCVFQDKFSIQTMPSLSLPLLETLINPIQNRI